VYEELRFCQKRIAFVLTFAFVLTIALPAAIASKITHPTLSPLVGYAKRSKP
jgi:hypothetical protein